VTAPASFYPVLALLVSTPITAETQSGVAIFNFTDFIYYSAATCLSPGQWRLSETGDRCLPCPVGCTCPGGARCWVLPGYWAQSDLDEPMQCSLAEACTGSSPFDGSFPPSSADGCAEGYTGVGCQLCSSEYYSSSSRCWSCSAGNGEFIALVLTAFGVISVLCICVFALNSYRLATVAASFLILQSLVTVGQAGAQNLPASASWFGEAITVLSVINFNVRLVKPGCVVPRLSYLALLGVHRFRTLGSHSHLAGLYRKMGADNEETDASSVSSEKSGCFCHYGDSERFSAWFSFHQAITIATC
jgi:hypothetical protein